MFFIFYVIPKRIDFVMVRLVHHGIEIQNIDGLDWLDEF